MHILIPLLILLAVVALFWVVLARQRADFRRGLTFAANIGEGFHETGVLSLFPDTAIPARYTLVKRGSDGQHIAIAGVADIPLGIATDSTDLLTGDISKPLAVRLFGATVGTTRAVAAGVIALDAFVVAAANGQVQQLAASTALRQAINIWRSQPILVPLWTDAVELQFAMSAGSNFLPVAATPGLPARSGLDWIVLNEDTGFYELIQVTNFNNAGLNLDGLGLQNTWPAGTRCYPLLIGRFEQRPTATALTGELLTASISVTEDSDVTRAISPNAPAPAAVGPAVPDFSSVPLWTIPPDHVEPTDTSEADVLNGGVIGFGRQSQRMDYPQAVRRKWTMDFKSLDRGTIAQVEAFWFDRRARTKVFAAPTWRNDIDLVQDVASGASTITVGATAWADPLFAAHPGAAFLALIDDQTFAVEPVRVTDISLGTVTLIQPVQADHSAANTLVSHLILARFNDDTLDWEYEAPLVATATLTFLEMSGEYAAPILDLPEPLFLYRFTLTLPNADTTTWLYTSYEASATIGADTYAVGPFSHKEIKSTLKLDQEEATLSSWLFPGNPLGLFLPFALEAPLLVTILEADARYLGTVTPTTIFAGEIWDVTPKGKALTAPVLAFGRTFEGKFPRALLQNCCNKIQYSGPCGLNADDWLLNATVAATNPASTQVTLTLGGAYVAGKFAAGWLQAGAGAAFLVRDVIDSTASTGNEVILSLNRPVSGLAVGSAVQVLPSCGNVYSGCGSFGNKANYFGFDYVPGTSPSIQAIPSSSSGGGSK